MTTNMNDSRLVSLAQLGEFLKVCQDIKFSSDSKSEKYAWINEILNRFNYFRLDKKDKGIVKDYLIKVTGYSSVHLKRLLAKKRTVGIISVAMNFGHRQRFPVIYTPTDIALLLETDNAHLRLSGPATKKLFNRAYEIFGDVRFEKLKDISVSHIYNLRGRRQYRSGALTVNPTPTIQRNIGDRRKPNPDGKPGYLRVDSVHQGDLDHEKGVYHINLVDAELQWEIIGCIEKISEHYLLPLLKDVLKQFPFVIRGFHSDNGSEYINKTVAALLNKLLIEQTKSRSRQTNDNALVEGKNGSIIRKHMGYSHISSQYANLINQFYQNYFNTYLNFHRPCGFATVMINPKGKRKKKYETYMTPYEKFKSLENPTQYLGPGQTIEALDELAYQYSDLHFAQLMQEAKLTLLRQINH
jgi:transposase InsO family protein